MIREFDILNLFLVNWTPKIVVGCAVHHTLRALFRRDTSVIPLVAKPNQTYSTRNLTEKLLVASRRQPTIFDVIFQWRSIDFSNLKYSGRFLRSVISVYLRVLCCWTIGWGFASDGTSGAPRSVLGCCCCRNRPIPAVGDCAAQRVASPAGCRQHGSGSTCSHSKEEECPKLCGVESFEVPTW